MLKTIDKNYIINTHTSIIFIDGIVGSTAPLGTAGIRQIFFSYPTVRVLYKRFDDHGRARASRRASFPWQNGRIRATWYCFDLTDTRCSPTESHRGEKRNQKLTAQWSRRRRKGTRSRGMNALTLFNVLPVTQNVFMKKSVSENTL